MSVELTRELEDLFRNINKLLNKYTKDHLREYDLTLPRFQVLWMIEKYQPVNMSTLHQKMYLAGSTLTVIVDHLVADELVKRYRDHEDRRVVLLEITSRGKERLLQLLELRQGFFHQALSVIEPERQEQLRVMLTPVLQQMRQQIKDIH